MLDIEKCAVLKKPSGSALLNCETEMGGFLEFRIIFWLEKWGFGYTSFFLSHMCRNEVWTER
jgi:hypothetical protein